MITATRRVPAVAVVASGRGLRGAGCGASATTAPAAARCSPHHTPHQPTRADLRPRPDDVGCMHEGARHAMSGLGLNAVFHAAIARFQVTSERRAAPPSEPTPMPGCTLQVACDLNALSPQNPKRILNQGSCPVAAQKSARRQLTLCRILAWQHPAIRHRMPRVDGQRIANVIPRLLGVVHCGQRNRAQHEIIRDQTGAQPRQTLGEQPARGAVASFDKTLCLRREILPRDRPAPGTGPLGRDGPPEWPKSGHVSRIRAPARDCTPRDLLPMSSLVVKCQPAPGQFRENF